MADSQLLQKFIEIMQTGIPPAFFMNKPFDIKNWAEKLFKDIEDKRSGVTALSRSQAQQLGQAILQFSSVKHESRLNCFYRLIGLPNELNISITDNSALLDDSGNTLNSSDDLSKKLLQREFEQLQLTFTQFLQSNSLQDLNTQLDATQIREEKLIAQLFDPNYIDSNRLFPILQYSQIQNIVESRYKIAPSFASMEERYINGILSSPPFLESVITIRLLPQSGGTTINSQGAVEDIILNSLAYALAELSKQYQRNQSDAEKMLIDGISKIRDKVSGVNSALVKQANIDANTRENDGIVTELDIRTINMQNQANLYSAIISLLPLDNDIIPVGLQISDVPFESRSIKNNALTSSFVEIINSNLDALQRATAETKKIIVKKKLTQDKLTAEIGSSIGQIGGISLAEIIIIISALFIIDENDLVGLLSTSRYNQIINTSNDNTSTSTASTDSSNQAQKQINIFDILKQFKDTKTDTLSALIAFQNTIKSIYSAFKIQLSNAHIN